VAMQPDNRGLQERRERLRQVLSAQPKPKPGS
jgi:hypothetical protein